MIKHSLQHNMELLTLIAYRLDELCDEKKNH